MTGFVVLFIAESDVTDDVDEADETDKIGEFIRSELEAAATVGAAGFCLCWLKFELIVGSSVMISFCLEPGNSGYSKSSSLSYLSSKIFSNFRPSCSFEVLLLMWWNTIRLLIA